MTRYYSRRAGIIHVAECFSLGEVGTAGNELTRCFFSREVRRKRLSVPESSYWEVMLSPYEPYLPAVMGALGDVVIST